MGFKASFVYFVNNIMVLHLSNRFGLISIAIGLTILFSISIARAQWISDSTHNTAVCDTAGTQDNPAICSDGFGGAIIAWQDGRSAPTHIYAQRIDNNGAILWTRQGVLLCKTSSLEQNPVIAPDGKGGAYVAWQDNRFTTTFGKCYFAQHVMPSGSLAYPDTALPVLLGSNDQQNAEMCEDGHGNAFFVAEDNRSADIQSRPDIFANKLWPGGIKYTDSICTASVGSMRTPWAWPPVPAQFNDGSATFKSAGEGMLPNLTLVVPGKGKYQIASVLDDTSLTFKSSPSNFEEQPYYILGLRGKAIDTSLNKQRNPSICNDGQGGCFVAWETSSTTPNTIRAMHFDSAFHRLWVSNPGYQISRGSENSSHVSIALDTITRQLMLAWEMRNGASADTQDVWVTRMNCETPADSSLTWTLPIQITGDAILNQVYPQVFSDDSVATWQSGKKVRGLMVPFETGSIGAEPDAWDVGMNRLSGDGTRTYPAPGSWYKIVNQPHGQVGFKAVKVDTGTILAVWNDARFEGTPDTCIYAQVMDKAGWRHIPTWKTTSTWGLPICHGLWTAKQVVLAPTYNGGIAAWTDYRKGSSNAGIYAQVIFKDGTLPIELENFDAKCLAPGEVSVQWNTASETSTMGFEIERRVADDANSDFVTIASYKDQHSLQAAGSVNAGHSYRYIDRTTPSIYEYRLAEISLNGARKTHQIVRVDASQIDVPSAYSIMASYSSDGAFIRVTTPKDVTITCEVRDVLGRLVAPPMSPYTMSAGMHDIELPSIPASAGTYFVSVQAIDQTTAIPLWRGTTAISLTRHQ
jgi:hypothetical protein